MTDEITPPAEDKPKRAARSTKATDAAPPELPQNIIHIIPAIRVELGAISKDQQATAGATFAYRGHDQIVNAIAPLFNKYGVFTTVEDESVYYGGREAANKKWATASVIRKKVTFYGPDGSSVSSTIVAESVDNGNKATSQAQTYAYRIALTQTFSIPTGEPDPDSTSGDFGTAGEAAAAPVRTQPTAPAAAAPSAPDGEVEALKASVAEHLKAHGIEGRDAIIAAGNTFFNGREGWGQNKAALTKWLKALESGEIPEKGGN
jgi:hypothetical protein